MGVRAGIVGLPNAGKSTLFNALASARVPAEAYPFCTVEPHTGVVEVPDPRLAALARVVRPARVVPATLELVDIAGLVRGASRGEGLGNRFLGHVRETHALVHVVRCFADPQVAHVEGSVDPLRDIETVETELLLADLETAERRLGRARRAAKSGASAPRADAKTLARLVEHLARGEPARTLALSPEEREVVRELHLLTAKPVLYVANVAEEGVARETPESEAVAHYAGGHGARSLRLCARIEAELAELEPAEREAFLRELGLEEPALHRLIRATYALLGLITFFTFNEKEARAWTVPRGTRAQEAAGTIHSDFARHFVRAEVIACEELVAAGGDAEARSRGKVRVEGRDYEVRDGDVITVRAAA